MSTYWYLDLNASLAVPEEDARKAFSEALSGIGHHFDEERLHFPKIIVDTLPFRLKTEDELAKTDLPAEGWTIRDGRLHACMFMEDLTSLSEDETQSNCDAFFACLTRVIDAERGDIVGALANENEECKGPLLRVNDVIRWLPSSAWHPGRGNDHQDPDLDSIDHIDADLLSDEGDGMTCDVDAEALIARQQRQAS